MPTINTQQALQVGLQHHQAGQLPQAEAIYRQILAQEPNHADATHLLGMVAAYAGQHQAAAELIQRAIALNPAAPEYHNNLGEMWRELGDPQKAMACYRQAIAIQPRYAAPHSNLGLVLQVQGRIDEAIAAFRTTLELEPQLASAHCNLGDALARAGRTDDALACYRRAIQLQPQYAHAHNNLGALLISIGQLDQAETALRHAVAVAPHEPDFQQNLGDLLLRKKRPAEALGYYQKAVQLSPRRAAAHVGMANALKESNHPDEAIGAYRQAIALQPDDVLAHANLGGTLRDRGQQDEAVAALRRALDLSPNFAAVHSSLILTLYLVPGISQATIDAEKQHWDERHGQPLAVEIPRHDNPPLPERRLRVGYISPDFREHPVGRFMLPLLAHHNHQQFEVVCYCTASAPDALTQRLRAHADLWREVVALDEAALARRIGEDHIDILVDLAMHTIDNRLLTLARKPAPLQVTYLATCDGAGLSAIDYRLSDPYVDPPAADPPHERPFRLPATYWCYAPSIQTPPVSALPALARGGGGGGGQVTFGSLNHFCKVTPAALETWCRLLQRVPQSRLLLHVPVGSPQERVRQAFAQNTIDLQRLELVPRVSVAQYFATYQQIDIALDTFPYVGGTTSCDALYMGVPVVSLAGPRPTSRGGLSILSNVGLPDLVASTPDEYVQIAAALAGDLPRLDQLRRTLRQRMEQSPLMDAPRFTRDVEDAFRTMWRRWCQTRATA